MKHIYFIGVIIGVIIGVLLFIVLKPFIFIGGWCSSLNDAISDMLRYFSDDPCGHWWDKASTVERTAFLAQGHAGLEEHSWRELDTTQRVDLRILYQEMQ